MIIPWQELPTETLENIVESVILRGRYRLWFTRIFFRTKKTTPTKQNSQWKCSDCLVRIT